MDNIQNITLDILNNKVFDYIYTKQYDVGRIVYFEITEGGKKINDLTNYHIVFSMKKPDGNVIVDGLEIVNNKAKLIIDSQMSVLAGRRPYELTLKVGDVTVSTVTGVFVCEKSVVQDGDIVSTSGGSLLEELLSLYENNIYQPTHTVLLANGWSGTNTQTYRQTVQAPHVVADQDNQFVVTHPKAEHMRAYVDAKIFCVEQGNGYLTFECDIIPSQDIEIYILTQGINSMTPNVNIEVSDTEPSQTENSIWLQPYPTTQEEEEVEP